MPALLTKDEATKLFAHLGHSDNPRKNMHTRDIVKPTKGVRKWAYLNGMKLTKNVISGHVHYHDGVEIEYKIKNDGTYVLSKAKNISSSKALTMIHSLKPPIMQAVSRGHSKNIRVRYTRNQYYLRRYSGNLTTTAQEAIQNGYLSKQFLTKMASWELGLIKGRK